MTCLIEMEIAETKSAAKMELISITSDLMPLGKPNFIDVVKYPMIRELVQKEGKKKMLALIVLLIKDYCSSINVVRNMNEDQMIEAAAMMLDECGNFRLEDYVMMFAMAKRGQLIDKLYQSIDITTISQIMDIYWEKRKVAAELFTEREVLHYDTLGPTIRTKELMNKQDADMSEAADKFLGAIDNLRVGFTEHIGDKQDLKKLQQTEKEDKAIIKSVKRNRN